jgi:hypothetical protein
LGNAYSLLDVPVRSPRVRTITFLPLPAAFTV